MGGIPKRNSVMSFFDVKKIRQMALWLGLIKNTKSTMNNVSDVRWLMVLNDQHKDWIRDRWGDISCIVTGYQLLFPGWKNIVDQAERKSDLYDNKTKFCY